MSLYTPNTSRQVRLLVWTSRARKHVRSTEYLNSQLLRMAGRSDPAQGGTRISMSRVTTVIRSS